VRFFHHGFCCVRVRAIELRLLFGACFSEFALDDAIGSHACSLEAAQVSTASYRYHRKPRPNTEGRGFGAGVNADHELCHHADDVTPLKVGFGAGVTLCLCSTLTMNSVATLMASHTTEGRVWCRVALCLCSTLTMNSVATLMASHNTEGRVWCRGDAVPVFNDNHELCRYTDDVTQH
jgi:hypothetical protein